MTDVAKAQRVAQALLGKPLMISRWTLPFVGECRLSLPIAADVLSVNVEQNQSHNQIALWTRAAETTEYEPRCFVTRGPYENSLLNERHIGTVYSQGLPYHVFEVL